MTPLCWSERGACVARGMLLGVAILGIALSLMEQSATLGLTTAAYSFALWRQWRRA